MIFLYSLGKVDFSLMSLKCKEEKTEKDDFTGKSTAEITKLQQTKHAWFGSELVVYGMEILY